MKKLAIVINGRGGVGKDTLCDVAAKHYKTVNISTITPIKEIASKNGWNGEKTPKARRFLAELKRVFTDFNDLPNKYAVEKYKDFLSDENELFFVHIREGKEISKFVEEAKQTGKKPITLLVVSTRCKEIYGNSSDDEVESFEYDYVYQNDLPLSEIDGDFTAFLNKIFEKEANR